MSLLYHYCSLESFLAILESKKVWLGDASTMNDSHEGKWADQLVQGVLNEIKPSLSDDECRAFAHGYNLNVRRPYLFCLSSKGDILSQWRAYAADATGVAIGFDANRFPRRPGLPAHGLGDSLTVGLWQVLYDQHLQRQLIRSFFDARAQPDSRDYASLGMQVAGLGPLLKNSAFSEEEEWRLVYTPLMMTNEANSHTAIGASWRARQRVSNARIVTYFEYPFPDPAAGFIKEVWLGPRSMARVADIELALALNELGKVSIRRSSATYR
ncbi:DUF2971 domain-containing protein [Ramlibacter monticola]|uniref:DUF2971 domain-containing protein n=1 Tax=Ramlibacter monticola TaxID=1926872 RepID=A0A937CSI3_9BURK|nr:DUF2971 domain-containing protein [Ramlibacter monticola]MBL0391231.1 DUF2971 domain-containing protein [Ramlibacter monticola]